MPPLLSPHLFRSVPGQVGYKHFARFHDLPHESRGGIESDRCIAVGTDVSSQSTLGSEIDSQTDTHTHTDRHIWQRSHLLLRRDVGLSAGTSIGLSGGRRSSDGLTRRMSRAALSQKAQHTYTHLHTQIHTTNKTDGAYPGRGLGHLVLPHMHRPSVQIRVVHDLQGIGGHLASGILREGRVRGGRGVVWFVIV